MNAILVIDDDSDLRDLIAWRMSPAGDRTITAADGEAAARHFSPALT